MKALFRLLFAASLIFTGRKAIALATDYAKEEIGYNAKLKISGFQNQVLKVDLVLDVTHIPFIPAFGISVDAPSVELFTGEDELIASHYPPEGEKVRLVPNFRYKQTFDLPLSDAFIRMALNAGTSIQNIIATIVANNQPLSEISLGIMLNIRLTFDAYRNLTFNTKVEL